MKETDIAMMTGHHTTAAILTATALAATAGLEACSGSEARAVTPESEPSELHENAPEARHIFLAGGCFWGTEEFFSRVPGVIDTEPGYANSVVAAPTYRQVCSGATDAAETVHVTYDPRRVSLERLLELYFMTIDPLSVNRQGPDEGTQYRTGIWYIDKADAPVVEQALQKLAAELGQTPAIEYGPLHNFYGAEEYHRNYLKRNPGGYCHIPDSVMRRANERR